MPSNEFYLGQPLTCSRITKHKCVPRFEKIIAKLQQWPSCKLSQPVRLTIVQSVAVAMTTYSTRHYIMLIKLINMVTSAINKFLWHGDPFSRKLIPISFHKLYYDKKYEGLGIINLHLWNKVANSVYFNMFFLADDCLWSQWVNHNVIVKKKN